MKVYKNEFGRYIRDYDNERNCTYNLIKKLFRIYEEKGDYEEILNCYEKAELVKIDDGVMWIARQYAKKAAVVANGKY